MAEVVLVRIGATPETFVHCVDCGDVVDRQLEVEDVYVFGNPFLPKRFWNGHEPIIDVPAKYHLCGGLAVLGSKLKDGWMRKRVAGAANAATERRPRLRDNAEVRVGFAHLPLDEKWVHLDLVSGRGHFRKFHQLLQMRRL